MIYISYHHRHMKEIKIATEIETAVRHEHQYVRAAVPVEMVGACWNSNHVCVLSTYDVFK